MIFLRDLLGCVLGDVCANFQKELAEGGVLKSILGSFCMCNWYVKKSRSYMHKRYFGISVLSPVSFLFLVVCLCFITLPKKNCRSRPIHVLKIDPLFN